MNTTTASLAARAALALAAAVLPAAASSISGSFAPVATSDPPFPLSSLGTSDWAYWHSPGNSPVAGTPTNRKAGGALVGVLAPVGGGSLRGTSSPTVPIADFDFTDGTAPAAGAINNPTGLFNSQLNTSGAGVSLQLTLPTAATWQVSLFVASFSAAGSLTASLPGAADFVDASLQGPNPPTGKFSGCYTLLVTPDAPNDVLTLSVVSGTSNVSNSHVLVNAAAVSLAPDPALVQDVVNADPDLAFGVLLPAPGSPVETPPRTVRFSNNGFGRDIAITSVTIANDATGSFTLVDVARNGTGGQTPPFVLDPGDYVEATVKGIPTRTGGANVTATLVVTTDEPGQDRSLPISAAAYAPGEVLNDNPLFEEPGTTPYANLWSPRHARVAPGLANGSDHMVRVVGIGDPDASEIGHANQASGIVNGVADFEAVFYFAPVAASEFPGYTGMPTAPDGTWTDRSMQYLLLADDTDARDGATLDPGETNNILVNLAYFPAGATSSGTPGFYVYDGATAAWQPALAVTLPGSVDANHDGTLNPADGDTVNACRVSVRGSGFGQAGASYTIHVSSPTNSHIAGTLSSAPLTAWHGTNGETGTLAAHSFTTADRSESNAQGGYCPPFWIDEATLVYVSQPDPRVTVVSPPAVILIDGDAAAGGTTRMLIRNDGGTTGLTVTGLAFDNPAFALAPAPGLPLVLAPGAAQALDIAWDPAASAPDTAALATLSIASNAAASPAARNLWAGVYSDANFCPNWNFEVPGTDPLTDADTFAFWAEGTGVTDVSPGLVAASNTAARVAAGNVVNMAFNRHADAWQVDSVFAVRDTAGRACNIKIRQALGGSVPELNIRYQAGVWSAFDTPTNDWVPVLDMNVPPLAPLTTSTDDAITAYRIRVTGAGWATGTPTFQLELFDAAGNPLATSAAGLPWFQLGPPTLGMGAIEFNAALGNCPGFWVDDTRASLATAGPGVVITGVSGGPGAFTIHYDAGGAAVNIERAGGDFSFSDIATGQTSGTYTDHSAPAGHAFYRVYIP